MYLRFSLLEKLIDWKPIVTVQQVDYICGNRFLFT